MNPTAHSMEDPQTRIAAVALWILGPVGVTLVPILIGTASDQLGLTPEQIGILAAADLAGLFVASLSAVYWVRKISWRKACASGLVILIVGNLLSIWATDYLLLCSLRFFTELGGGILLAVLTACIGDVDKPDRYFAIGIAGTILLSIVFFMGLPPLIGLWGASVIYISHAVLAGLAFSAVGWLPVQGCSRAVVDSDAHSVLVPTFFALMALFCVAAAEGGLWSYLGRIGKDAGFSLAATGRVLAIANLTCVAGALTTSVLSTRFGRTLPLCLGLTIFIIGAVLLNQQVISLYVVGVVLTQFCWGFTLPYIMLMIVESDASGRYFILLIAFKLGGFALGPAIAALFLLPGSYLAVSWVCVAFLLLCLTLIFPLSSKLDRGYKPHAETPEPLLGSF